MAKHGGFPGMGGGNNMMKQVQKLQQDMAKAQSDLEEREFSAQSGGGVVSVTVNGKHEVRALTIKPEAVDPDDVEMLQDLVISAVNAALKDADDTAAKEMSRFTGGLGGLGLGF